MKQRNHQRQCPDQLPLRGFSLLEMMVALGIGAAVIAVGTSGVVAINERARTLARNSALDQDLQMIIEYVIAEAQGAGGGALRPAGAVKYEPGVHMEAGAFVTTAGGPDSVTFYMTDDSLPECQIESFQGVNTVFKDGTTIYSSGTKCCADSYTANQYVSLVSKDGTLAVGQVFSLNGSCKENWPPGNFPEFSNAGDFQTKMSGGTAVVIRARRFYLDTTNHQLKLDDFDLSGNSRTRVIAEDVYDFQVALGYDMPDPDRDGIVTDDGSSTDEWLGNNASDSMATGALSAGGKGDLRRIAIGVTVGVPAGQQTANSRQLLDGNSVSVAKTYLRSAISRATFRNLFIYN